MTDPIEDIIGDYRAFAAQQRDRLLARGIDMGPYALSHLAFRVPEWDMYLRPNSNPDPVYILMEDFTHVKFYDTRCGQPSSRRVAGSRGSSTWRTGRRRGW